uniref:Grainyhead-like protein 2 homolog n=1 Tax=Phallusia mammillata TaxID=59560 RepID=A0A6F9DE87_9ASCI|nr:grainyhead-like protein 2 homolog [Phallusia mammillata]
MHHPIEFSPLHYSPVGSVPESTSSERRPSSNDAGYCSSNNSTASLANIRPSGGHELLGVELEQTGAPNFPDSAMTFCNPDDFILSLDSSRQNQRNNLNNFSDLQQPARFSNPPLVRRNSVAACQSNSRQRGQFCHSENSAFSPSYSGKSVALRGSNLFRDRIPDPRPLQHQRNNCDLQSAMQPLAEYERPQADVDHASVFNQHSSNLICINGDEKLPDRFNPLRRQLSDCAGQECLRYESSGQFNNSDFSNSMNKYSSQCLTPPSLRSGSWEGQCATKPALEDLGFMDPALLTLPHQANSIGAADSVDKPVDLTQPFVNQGSLDHLSSGRSHEPGVMGPIGSSSAARDAAKTRYTSEDEAWKSYLENPLTAATTAMISIHGDEDSAAALGLLYDYYKVPREKRILSYHTGETPVSDVSSTVSRKHLQGHDVDSSNGTLSDDVSILSPVSNVSNSRAGTHADLILRDVVAESSSSLTCTANDVSMTQSDVITLSAVRSELSTLSESSCFPSDYSRKFHHATPSQASDLPRSQDHRSISRYTDNISPNCFTTSFNSNNNNNTITHRSLTSKNNSNNLLGSPLNSVPNSFSHPDPHVGDCNSSKLFEYVMEAPKSLKQKDGEPTMSYINKGQFYCISLRDCSGVRSRLKGDGLVTSVVQVVFGDGKPEEEQLRHWKYWHSRQHTAKQRVIDIADYKESCMITDIDEFSHNAISFKWNPNDAAKIFISCNCLSTDFSAQKGIKGLPLLLQIDTYLDERRVGVPAHRGVCQLKVFCDKGAERKIRDEERKAMRKKQKSKGPSSVGAGQRMNLSPVNIKPVIEPQNVTPPPQQGSNQPPTTSHKRLDVVYFKTIADRVTPSVYFVPDVYVPTNRVHVTVSPCQRAPETFINGMMTPTSVSELDQVFLASSSDYSDLHRIPNKRTHSMVSSEDGEFPPPSKVARTASDGDRRVLLYVRKGCEDVYDGVMLREPTLKGLKDALEEKYTISANKISKVLKKSKKGILVNVDDNIVQHYSNEDTFAIEITSQGAGDDVTHQVVLTVV